LKRKILIKISVSVSVTGEREKEVSIILSHLFICKIFSTVLLYRRYDNPFINTLYNDITLCVEKENDIDFF